MDIKIKKSITNRYGLVPNIKREEGVHVRQDKPITTEMCVDGMKELILSCKLCGCPECVRRKNIYLKTIELLREK